MRGESKKGSHVGMIISFLIFITFTVFLYVIISPAVETGESKKTTLDYVGNEIEENVSANFTSASIQIESSKNPPGQSCLELENFFILSDMPFNAIIKNETNNIQEAYVNFANLLIVRKAGTNIFFKVYASPEFSPLQTKTMSCFFMRSSNYNIGSITTRRYVFEKSMNELVDYYNSDYERLKDEFKIPPGTEFGFDFVQSNGTRIKVGQPPSNTNVYTQEAPVQYIDYEANILSGFINVKVW